MKSKLNKQQENNFKLSFIPFGILIALLSSSAFANKTHETTTTAQTYVVLQKPELPADVDTLFTIGTGDKKSIEEIIKEDNLIIDSQISNETYPFDFNTINKGSAKRSKVKSQNGFSHNPDMKS